MLKLLLVILVIIAAFFLGAALARDVVLALWEGERQGRRPRFELCYEGLDE